MILGELWQQIAAAVFGGIAAEVLHWYLLARKPEPIKVYNKVPFWITTFLMIVVSAAMPVLYVQGEASALLCFHLGAATPILLQKLVSTLPVGTAHLGADKPTLKRFFSW